MGQEIIKASLGKIVWAMENLTLVEFRMWLIKCKTSSNTLPANFFKAEERFIKTGAWDIGTDDNGLPKKKSGE